jgi:hypothetical protein
MENDDSKYAEQVSEILDQHESELFDDELEGL